MRIRAEFVNPIIRLESGRTMLYSPTRLIQIQMPVVNWKCTAHREVNWRAPRASTRRQRTARIFPSRLIDATPIFRSGSINHLARPLRWPLSVRRDFSPRAKLAMHRIATNEYATFPPRCTTTALWIIELHPRCVRAHANAETRTKTYI